MAALFLAFASSVCERGSGREGGLAYSFKKKKLTNFISPRYQGLKYSTVLMFIKMFILPLFFM